MNKLVSRNLVLRFKEGKKIVKAQEGLNLTYHGLPVRKAKKNRYIVWNPSIGEYDANVTIPLNGIDTKIGIGNTQGRVYRGSDGNWYQNGKMMTKFTNSSENPFNVNNPKTWGRSIGTITVTPKTSSYYYINGYKDRTAGLGLRSRADVMNWLKKIGVKADGIWGDKTEAAYKRYMNNLLPVRALEASPLSFLPYVEKYDIKPKDFVSAIDKKYEQPIIRPTQSAVTLYDRSGTRDWITTKLGHNPYEYTGAQRRALRYWLNGDKEGLNYDKNLLRVFGNLSLYAKQGAKLVSKNPIERFLQGRNLPTAPKAEDRYRNGRRTWNMPQYKEVSSASNIFGDPFASRIAMEINDNNDTTFYETPGRWLPVKFKTRTASKKNLNFKTLSQYNGLPIQENKTIVISPEYETLKRRFNTAWNLAK